MDFKFTQEEEAFRKEVQGFIQQVLPADWEGHGYLFDFPDEYWDLRIEIMLKVKAMGWGSGGKLNEIEHLILAEEGAYWGVPGFVVPNFIGVLIDKFGNEYVNYINRVPAINIFLGIIRALNKQ